MKTWDGNIIHHSNLSQDLHFDAPAVVYANNAYYLRHNDPKEFIDVPGYEGPWINLDGMERDRRIHIINTPAINNINLDYAIDWYADETLFKSYDEETLIVLFGKPGMRSIQNKFYLSYSAYLHGTITGDVYQAILHFYDGIEVVAVPVNFYRFFRWADGCSSATRRDEYVICDISGKALFEKDHYHLIYYGDIVNFQIIEAGTTGETVTVEMPEHYVFTGWSDGILDESRQDDSDTIVYTTKELEKFILEYTGGDMNGETPQEVKYQYDGTAVEAIEPTGQIFDKWSDESLDNPRTEGNVSADLSVEVSYKTREYDLKYFAAEDIILEGEIVQAVEHGENGTLVSAILEEGFVTWSDYSVNPDHIENNVRRDINRIALVRERDTCISYTVEDRRKGYISGNAAQILLMGESGTSVIAIPREGYVFSHWSDGYTGIGRKESYVFTPIELTAYFVRREYLVEYLVDDRDEGYIEANDSQVVQHDFSSTPVNAVPKEGFEFDRWEDGKTINPRHEIHVTDNQQHTAYFKVAEYDLHYHVLNGGSITGECDQTVEHNSDGTEVEAVPDDEYRFIKWSDSVLTKKRQDFNVKENIYVIAEFQKKQFVIEYLGEYLSGETLQIVEIGGAGSSVTCNHVDFKRWSDGKTNKTRYEKNVESDVLVMAITGDDNHVISYLVDPIEGEIPGYIQGDRLQLIVGDADCTAIRVVANPGYSFISWSDGSVNTDRHEKGTTEDTVFTAIFEKVEYTLRYEYVGEGHLEGETTQNCEYGRMTNPVLGVSEEDIEPIVSRIITGVGDTFIITSLYPYGNYLLINGLWYTPISYDFKYNRLYIKEDTSAIEEGMIAEAYFSKTKPFRWSDGFEGTEHYLESITQDTKVIADFSGGYFLLYGVEGHGSITGETIQVVPRHGNGIEVSAVADEGYMFATWSDGYTQAKRIDLDVTKDIDVTARFIPRGDLISTSADLAPGDLILRDQRWFGTLTGNKGDLVVSVEGIDSEISDKWLSTEHSELVDSGYVTAIATTHITTDLYDASNYVAIDGNWYTVIFYDGKKLYLQEDFSSVTVGMEIHSYRDIKGLPINDNDWNAWASGSELRINDETYPVIDHYPNARSIVMGKNDIPMYNPSTERYQDMSQHPDPIDSRLLPEVWQYTGEPTTRIRLKTALTQDYTDEPFSIVNKQWYVATVEVLSSLPTGHEPKCWQILRVGGQDIPYRLRRCVFPTWQGNRLDGDVIYSFGKQIDPPFEDYYWTEKEEEPFNPSPNWYQEMPYGATFTRILTVPEWKLYEDMKEFEDIIQLKDMLICNLGEENNAYKLTLPRVDETGLIQVNFSLPLFGAKIFYV